MTDSNTKQTDNALQPMQLHLLANIHNVAASSHFRRMRVGNVDESISKAVASITAESSTSQSEIN